MDGCDLNVLVIYPLFLFAFWLCLSLFFVYVLGLLCLWTLKNIEMTFVF